MACQSVVAAVSRRRCRAPTPRRQGGAQDMPVTLKRTGGPPTPKAWGRSSAELVEQNPLPPAVACDSTCFIFPSFCISCFPFSQPCKFCQDFYNQLSLQDARVSLGRLYRWSWGAVDHDAGWGSGWFIMVNDGPIMISTLIRRCKLVVVK